MSELRIRIGVTADPNLRKAFMPLEESMRRAAAAVKKERGEQSKGAAKAAADEKRSADQGARAKERALAHVAGVRSRYFAAQQRQEEKAARDSVRAHDRAAKEKARIDARSARESRVMATREAREQAKLIRDNTRLAEREARETVRARDRFKDRVGGNLRAATGAAARFGKDMLGAAGVDLGIGAAVNRNLATKKNIRMAAQSDAIANGRPVQESDMDAVKNRVRQVGDDRRIGYEALSEGVANFAATTSDLKTGLAILNDAGKIANATGADIADMMKAAGAVSKEIADGPEKLADLNAALRVLAAQGGKGAIEFADAASVLGRAMAGAGKIAGDRSKNIGEIGAMIQFAASEGGGKSSPEEAATATKAFQNALTKEGTLKAAKKYGVDIFSDKSHTKTRSLKDISTDILEKTGGDLAKINEILKDTDAQAGISHLAKVYNEGGGKKGGGRAALDARWKEMTGGMDDKQIDAGDALAKKDAGAVAFNNALEKMADIVTSRLGPAMETMVPWVDKASKALADLTKWASENPKTAIAAAFGAVILKSGAETVIKDGFAALLKAAGGGGGGPGGGPGGGASPLGKAGAVAAAGAGGWLLGDWLANEQGDRRDLEQSRRVGRTAASGNTIAKLEAANQDAADGSIDKRILDGAYAEGVNRKIELSRRVEESESRNSTGGSIFQFAKAAFMPGTNFDRNELAKREDAKAVGQDKADNAKIESLLAELNQKMGGGLRVTVTNMPLPAPGGRDGPPKGVFGPGE